MNPTNLKILVVDDDTLISMATAELIAECGHTALEANSGEQALAMLAEDPAIALMITDYAMPGMSGVELAAAATAKHPDLRVLLATGYADLPSGMKTTLQRIAKPFDESDLQAQITALLGGA